MLEIRTVEYGDGKSLKTADVNRSDLIEKPLWFHKRNLHQTRSGYGRKLSTEYMVKHNNRLYRVYCQIFSNAGSLYILVKGERIYIDIF